MCDCTTVTLKQGGGGVYTHRCCTDSCDRGQNVVKRSSNVYRGAVERSSGRFRHLYCTVASMSRLRMRNTFGSKGQGHKSGVVKRSRLILDGQPGRSYMYSAYMVRY